ncbi:hypothetical protein HGRIS_013549 [Hohenbuehelia grisea]|uniref:glucan 1,3-beta-glucosidase n=1 Tax=Hohenbuehelia grisea TaxID=104357 RepID=A0ABR3IW49_9AGAR
MAQPNPQPSSDIQYDPLPLTQDHSQGYDAPSLSNPGTPSFNSPRLSPAESPAQSALGAGTPQPRFIGAALYSEGGNPRDSVTSSQPTLTGNSEYSGSVYALKDTLGSHNSAPYRDDPSDGYDKDAQGHPMLPLGNDSRFLGDKEQYTPPPKAKSRRKVIILAILAALILLILAIVIPVYFAVVRPKTRTAVAPSDDSTSDPGHEDEPNHIPAKPVAAIVTGGDGSKVTLEDGTEMTYRNTLGGYWYYDENDPFNNGARAQAHTPALNETFRYGIDRIRGVNLGGWLNTEPFISPAIYEKYSSASPPVVDEWSLSVAMRADAAGGGIDQMEEHYRTFITEKDFAEIAGAGLNYVRIPIGYWAVETKQDEPFLAKTSWTYFLKAIKWSRKYGLRINLDLHAIPGSQNVWNHSGRQGRVNFLKGPMGYANAQRALDIIRVLAEFISQDQYKDVVTMFGILNEPQETEVGHDSLSRFYMEAYKIVRTASGVGEGKGPIISFHDGFSPRGDWAGFIPNADRIALDSHPYIAFNGQSDSPMSSYANVPCRNWGASFNASMGEFGLTTAGEWSNAVTDCGLFLNGVGDGVRYEGTHSASGSPRVGSCERWTDWAKYSTSMKRDIMQFTMASMDAFQNYFFWTWKIGPSLVTGKVETPAWSYQLGLINGWMPTDPRQADGVCGNIAPWTPPLRPGSGNVPAGALSWPPPSITQGGPATLLPAYTPTGPIPTLPGPTLSGAAMTATPDVGSGWANANDNAGYMTEIATCSYLPAWPAATAQVPPLCGVAARREAAPLPGPTPAP